MSASEGGHPRRTRFSGFVPAAASIALLYLIVALLWIYTSGRVADLLFGQDSIVRGFIEYIKGYLFVSLSALVIYLLVARAVRRVERARGRFDLALRASNVGFWDWHVPSNTVYFSDTWKTQLGYEPHELRDSYEQWRDLLHPDDRDAAERALRAYLDNPAGAYEQEVRMRHKSGAYRWIVTRGELTLDEAGKPYRLAGSHIDITERRLAEESQRQAEERYRLLVDLMPDGVIVHQDGVVVYANGAAAIGIGGSSPAPLRGRNVLDFVHEDDRPVLQQRVAVLLQGGPPQPRREIRIRRDDGVLIEAETAAAAVTFGGKPAILAVIRDISDRKEADRALQATLDSLQRERRLFIGGPAIVWRWRNDPGWPVEYVSPNIAQFGYSEEEFVSGAVQYSACIHPEDLSRVAHEVESHVASGDPSFEQEYRLKTRSGDYRTVYDFTVIVRDAKGAPTHFQGYTLDITERRRAEDALRKSESTLRALLDAIPDLLFRLSPDGRYVDYHLAEGARLLVPPEQFLGRRPADVLPPHVGIPTEKTLAAVLADGKPRIFEYSARPIYPGSHVHGAEFEVRMVRSPTGDAVALVREITERKRAERFREGQSRVLELLASGAPIAEVLSELITVIEEQDGELLGSVLLLQPDGRRVRCVAAPSLPPAYAEGVNDKELGPDSGSCGAAMARRQRIITEDIQSDPNWAPFREFVLGLGLRACWSEPILAADGSVLGTFGFYYRTPRTPPKHHADLIAAAARLAALAIERRRAEAALMESEERNRRLLETLPVGVLAQQDGRIVFMNSTGLEMLGRAEEAAAKVIGQPILNIVHEDSRPVVRQRINFLRDTREPVPPIAQRWYRLDGSIFDAEVAAAPITLGGRHAAIVTFVDITGRRRAERRQQLMMAELDHRVKNNLAAVISLTEQTARTSPDVPTFQRNLITRLRALARLHQALARGRWEGVELANLVSQTLGAFVPAESDRVHFEGPEATLPARAAGPIAMALNELATNAVKYGALSGPGGRVDLRWTLTPRDGSPHPLLTLDWAESGGPSVTEPAQRGFGTDLVEEGLAYELGGRAEIKFDPAGLKCRIEVPLEPESEHEESISREA